MNYVCQGAKIYKHGQFVSSNLFVKDGYIKEISSRTPLSLDGEVFDFSNAIIVPGLIDVHSHLREPGFFYKETIKTGTLSAAHGGFTTVFNMANLNPVPDCYENLKPQLDLIENSALVNVCPIGAITMGEKGETLSKMDELAPFVVAFSDDGKGIQKDELMLSAMQKAKALDKIIVAHCEDMRFVEKGGAIHDGEKAKELGVIGISSKSEWAEVERNINLAKQTGAKLHICHVSTKESVELIRKAKLDGVSVTAETAPHYLVLCQDDVIDEGRFKMNPPVRDKEDRQALIGGIIDGTIDTVATDHAPHSFEEKSKGLAGSLFGIVGFETAFALCYTYLVKTGIISLEKLMEVMHDNPKKRFGVGNDIEENTLADFAVFDINDKFTINSDGFFSMGKATPFENYEVYGDCLMTVCGGKKIWQRFIQKN